MSKNITVTGTELKIVEILLETKQPMTNSNLRTVLNNMNIGWSPETIRKFMERLENKRVVASSKKGKLRYYYMIVSEENINNDEAKKIVDFHFQGSLINFLSAFTRKNKLSKHENRLLNMPTRRLTDSEKKWLENHVHDSCPEVAELACFVYNMSFPHAKRNDKKKQLHINALTFEVHGKVYHRYGNYEMLNRRFFVVRKVCALVYTDLNHNEYSNDTMQDIACYGGDVADKVDELYWELLGYFNTAKEND